MNMRITMLLVVGVLAASSASQTTQPKAGEFRAAVEVEEDVYRYEPANNGAGPMWCFGSTCLVRVGEEVFASGLETLPDAKPLNNCRWTLYKRTVARSPRGASWELQQADAAGRTREPCPMATLPGGGVLLSANPTLATDRNAYSGPARPEILRWPAGATKGPAETLLPTWQGQPAFTEHSYRSLAADGQAGSLILFQNIGYTHAEWAYRGADPPAAGWAAAGKLPWPFGAEYDKPQPIRVCYPNVAIRGRAVYFCGVSDIVEPYAKWRQAKEKLTGQKWDYDFRRLFYTWSDDITTGKFHDWVEIASRDKTCGWISPCDLWVGGDGAVHLMWTEKAIDERLRKEFFPGEKQSHALCYAVVREGKVVRRTELLRAEEGKPGLVAGRARFHATPSGRLLAFLYVSGHDATGKSVSENRLIELRPDGSAGLAIRVELKHPFTDFFTATPRAGTALSAFLDILGPRAGGGNTISYARIRVGP